MKTQLLVIMLIFMLVFPAVAFAPIPTTPAGGSTVVNIGGTLKGDKGDTGAANMTAGATGATGAANMTMNMTANMTSISELQTADDHIAINLSSAKFYTDTQLNDNQTIIAGWIATNNTANWNNLTSLFASITSLFTIDSHIETNRTAIEQAMVVNQSAVWNNASFSINTTYATTWNLSITNSTLYSIVNDNMTLANNNLSITNATLKAYIDAVNISMLNNVSTNFLNLDGSREMTGNLNMNNKLITNLISNTGWSDAVNKSYVDTFRNTNRTRPVVIESDFFDASTYAVPGLLGVAIGSGTVAAAVPTANHPGVVNLLDSTTAGGGYRFGCSGANLIAGNELAEFIFTSTGVRYNQTARLGWADTTTVAAFPVDGIYLNITGRTALDKEILTGVSASNSVRTATASNYALTAATWYRGVIVVSEDGTRVSYTLYDDAGAVVWTDTTSSNIPTGAGRETSPCIIAGEPSGTTGAVIVTMDYAKWDVNRTVTRG